LKREKQRQMKKRASEEQTRTKTADRVLEGRALGGQKVHARRKEHNAMGKDTQLTGLGATRIASNTQNITTTEILDVGEVILVSSETDTKEK
jgi:hypothetical protein